MRALLLLAATVAMVGCVSSTMNAAREGQPTARFTSSKAAAQVAQCIQYGWQDEAVFGEDAGGYLEPRKPDGFTVATRGATAFVDVYPAAGGTQVDFYAPQADGAALRRRASAGTCL